MIKFSKTKSFAVLLAFSLSACSIIPETINSIDESKLVPFESLSASESAIESGIARWGGKIVSVQNLKDHSEIEILHLPTLWFLKKAD